MNRLMKTAAAVASGFAMTATVTIAAELPANAAGCNTTFSRYKAVKAGSSGTQAKAAQCLLRSAGHSVKADGSFSAADAAKLKTFQSRHKLARTGRVDARSWTALLARGSKPALRVGKRGAAVKRLQRSLTASGRPVPVTGYFGPITKNAVKSVQRAKGWSATGTATTSVWRTLQGGGAVRSAPAKPVAKKKSTKTAKARSGSRSARALAYARRQIGDRYVFGASGPNRWDCSGLTMAAWRSAGVRLPHSARQQFRKGQRVSRANLRPGDLVFFYSGISHVGLYAGNGKVLHAANPRKPVGYLKMSAMPYMGARRVG
jgi:cell wall-associated NlpC family hydrolase